MLQFLIALLPVIWLIIALAVIKMPGWRASAIAVALTAALAIGFYGMKPANAAGASLEGVLNALWPILCVIISALFVYNLTLETGAMDSIKKMLSGVSPDSRIVALIIVWGFGNFMEGMAGFGTAVAIPAGILVAMGYDPIPTVIACLVVNSTPTAFGSVGVPTSTLAQIAGINSVTLSGKIVIVQFVLTFIAPFVLIFLMGKGIRALKGMWLMCLISSVSFILPQFAAAYFIGPELPNIIGSIVCMAFTIAAALKLGKKRAVPEEYRMPGNAQPSRSRNGSAEASGAGNAPLTLGGAVRAWCPFLLIFVILLFTSSLFPAVHSILLRASTTVSVYPGDNPGALTFSWIDCPGVKIILAGILGGLIQGASPAKIARVFARTVKDNVRTIVTICCVLAVAKIMSYSGMISVMASVLVAATGSRYPAIAPFIGMIGGFVTGSGTSTSVLFGGLQAQTAARLGISTEWLAAANMMGAGIGKMISPQGIAIGTASSGLGGKESLILTRVIGWALVYIIIGGILCYAGLNVFS